MTGQFPKKDKRCYFLFGYAPEGTSFDEANRAFNDFIGDSNRGLVLFHDHFNDRAGGVTVFFIETAEELTALGEAGT